MASRTGVRPTPSWPVSASSSIGAPGGISSETSRSRRAAYARSESSWVGTCRVCMGLIYELSTRPEPSRQPPRAPARRGHMSDLPTSARAVVIGAGIVGNSLSYHLSELGWRDLVLLD